MAGGRKSASQGGSGISPKRSTFSGENAIGRDCLDAMKSSPAQPVLTSDGTLGSSRWCNQRVRSTTGNHRSGSHALVHYEIGLLVLLAVAAAVATLSARAMPVRDFAVIAGLAMSNVTHLFRATADEGLVVSRGTSGAACSKARSSSTLRSSGKRGIRFSCWRSPVWCLHFIERACSFGSASSELRRDRDDSTKRWHSGAHLRRHPHPAFFSCSTP